jgi:hypothetical protein
MKQFGGSTSTAMGTTICLGANKHFAELRQWIVKRDRKLDGCDVGNGHALMTSRLPRRSKI